MKKVIALFSIAVFATAVLAFAAGDAQTELHHSQKLMQARKAWAAAMNENLGAKKFEVIVKDADELAAQTGKVAENIPNPLGKELTLAISSLAKEVSAAAAQKNGNTIKVKLGEIKDKCAECHAKIRDKK